MSKTTVNKTTTFNCDITGIGNVTLNYDIRYVGNVALRKVLHHD